MFVIVVLVLVVLVRDNIVTPKFRAIINNYSCGHTSTATEVQRKARKKQVIDFRATICRTRRTIIFIRDIQNVAGRG